MKTYHLRRSERAISDLDELRQIIASRKHMTLALCRDGEPYLVTVNYGYDVDANCFYFHCADEGKKVDYLEANDRVWGQVLQDMGYADGACDHRFRSVHFGGRVVWLTDLEEKRRALTLMIEQLEPDPEPVKARQVTDRALQRVRIGRLDVEGMSGKENTVRSQ